MSSHSESQIVHSNEDVDSDEEGALHIVEPEEYEEDQVDEASANAPPPEDPSPLPGISAAVLADAIAFVEAEKKRIAAAKSAAEADAAAADNADTTPKDMIIPLFIYAFAVTVHHTISSASVVNTSATPQKEGEQEHNNSMDACSKESNNEYFSASEGTGSSSGFLSAAEGSDSLQDVSNTFADVRMWAHDRNVAQHSATAVSEAVPDILENNEAVPDILENSEEVEAEQHPDGNTTAAPELRKPEKRPISPTKDIFPLLHVSCNGAVSMWINDYVKVEQSVDRCVWITHSDKFSAFVNEQGNVSSIVHNAARIANNDERIYAKVSLCENDHNAIIDANSIIFTSSNQTGAYLLSRGIGLSEVDLKSLDFTLDCLNRDVSVYNFYNYARTGHQYGDAAQTILLQSEIRKKETGRFEVEMDGYFVSVLEGGELDISFPPTHIHASKDGSSIYIKTRIIEMCVEEGKSVRIKLGNKRIHASLTGMMVCDGTQSASMDAEGHLVTCPVSLITFNSTTRRPRTPRKPRNAPTGRNAHSLPPSAH
ncbi:unnamed protein product [Cylicocyclus nassatus]|uniref:Uncharacterized protein n=1 Tax=Cylicocyclus nassatus TaxID=53992 RepID=A0AA36HGU1_CYLNA|nr:unnamed protein product [Cylicocyclus nassatus]